MPVPRETGIHPWWDATRAVQLTPDAVVPGALCSPLMGAKGMAEVQLEEDPAPAADPPYRSAAAQRARVLLRRWWPVPLAAVLAVPVWQAVADGRAEDRANGLRGTPGVLAETVSAPLEATPWGSSEALGILLSGTRTEDGLVAGVLIPGTGTPASVVALDPDTGEEVWRAEIGVLPDDTGYTRAASCTTGSVEPAQTLWCTVTDGSTGSSGPVTTRLVEVDLEDRAVAGSRDLPPGAEATVVRDTLVVGTEQDGAFLLVGSDLADGAERWRTELADAGSELSISQLASAGGHVLVHGASGTWAVDPDDGRVQAQDVGLFVGRNGALVAMPSTDGLQTRLLGADGAGTATVEGYVVGVSPDDGSAADIEPVLAPDVSGGILHGVDVATGDVRWERGVEAGISSAYLLLDGVLYGSDRMTVWAVDAETGAELWTTSAASPVDDSGVMTDGRHLLRAERADPSGELVLSAYALDSGRRAWTTPVPEGVQRLWPEGGVLYGFSDDGQQLFRLR